MRVAILISLAAFAVASAAAAAQPAELKTYTSAAEVAALQAKAKAERKTDQPTLSQPLLRLAPYAANLEYRATVGPAAVHEDRAEFFYVVDGSGTLTTGGRLRGETRTNPTNLSGTGIDGGESRKVAKGDLFIVPEKTPHQFTAIDGELVLVSMHVPRTAP